VFRDQVVTAVSDARFDTKDESNEVTGTISLREMLTYYPANVAMDRRQFRDGWPHRWSPSWLLSRRARPWTPKRWPRRSPKSWTA
jgi:hypothetical protein